MTSLAGELEVVRLPRVAQHDPVKPRMIGKGSQLHEPEPVAIESDYFVEAIRWSSDAHVCSLNHSFKSFFQSQTKYQPVAKARVLEHLHLTSIFLARE